MNLTVIEQLLYTRSYSYMFTLYEVDYLLPGDQPISGSQCLF